MWRQSLVPALFEVKYARCGVGQRRVRMERYGRVDVYALPNPPSR